MEAILNLTLPFFALVGLGYFSARLAVFDENAVRILNAFVFNFAMPALVIGALARQDFSDLIDLPVMAGWLVSAVTIYIIAMGASRLMFNATLSEMALFGQASSVSNVGFLAIPLIASAFGPDAVRIPATLLVIDLMIIIPISIAMIEAKGGGSIAQSGLRAMRGAIANPFSLAILAGFILSATGIGLPGPTDRFASFLAGAAGPTALFALGLSLSGRQMEGDVAPVSLITFLKLVAHPALTYIIMLSIGVKPEVLALAVVVAAMPVAGNVFVIAEQYGVMVRRSSTVILISTMLAIVSAGIVLNLDFVSPFLQ